MSRSPSAIGVPRPDLPLKVGNETDQAVARKAVRALRAMVRLGRIAEAALADLERDGFSRRRVAILWPEKFSRNAAYRFHGVKNSFALEPAPAADLSFLIPAKFGVKVEQLMDRRTMGRTRISGKVEVNLFAPYITKGWGRSSAVLGVGNLNTSSDKASFTFNADLLKKRYRNGSVYTNSHLEYKRTFRTSEPLEEDGLRTLCDAVSNFVAGCPHNHMTPPEMVAVRRALPDWLCSKGVHDRIWRLIREEMEQFRIASQVLDT